jgi:hypothetical protein
MPKHVITLYEVYDLLDSKKVIGRKKSDDPLRYDVRRVDSPNVECGLVLEIRTPPKAPSGVPTVQKPSASLLLKNRRICGIDWTIKHEVTRNGVPTGEWIKGWHEHFWTIEDECSSIRAPASPPKNHDVAALIAWCCEHWNIEKIESSMRLFDEQ